MQELGSLKLDWKNKKNILHQQLSPTCYLLARETYFLVLPLLCCSVWGPTSALLNQVKFTFILTGESTAGLGPGNSFRILLSSTKHCRLGGRAAFLEMLHYWLLVKMRSAFSLLVSTSLLLIRLSIILTSIKLAGGWLGKLKRTKKAVRMFQRGAGGEELNLPVSLGLPWNFCTPVKWAVFEPSSAACKKVTELWATWQDNAEASSRVCCAQPFGVRLVQTYLNIFDLTNSLIWGFRGDFGMSSIHTWGLHFLLMVCSGTEQRQFKEEEEHVHCIFRIKRRHQYWFLSKRQRDDFCIVPKSRIRFRSDTQTKVVVHLLFINLGEVLVTSKNFSFGDEVNLSVKVLGCVIYPSSPLSRLVLY